VAQGFKQRLVFIECGQSVEIAARLMRFRQRVTKRLTGYLAVE
jgi:hypothetical protein